MTESFSLEQFESALPKNKNRNNEPLCVSKGLTHNEYTFLLPISAYAGVMIRSSVDHTGVAASAGEDSIRLWLVDPVTMEPVGAKVSKYVTRVRGWQDRMVSQLRTLYVLGKLVRPCGCGNGLVKVNKVKKDGPNKGKLFTSCSDRGCRVTSFAWVEEPKIQKKAA
jgi:hypothetical protein